MAREFKETAHLKTDLEKYGEGWDRIFRKNKDAGLTPEMLEDDFKEYVKELNEKEELNE